MLIVSYIYAIFRKRRRGGAIALPPDEEQGSARPGLGPGTGVGVGAGGNRGGVRR